MFTARRTVVALAGLLLAVLTAVVAARHGTPFGFDVTLHRWTLAHRDPALTDTAVAITTTGNGGWAYALAATAGLVAARRRWWWFSATLAVAALTTAQLVRRSLAVAVGRARPPESDWVLHASGFAFPSGHTTTSALVAAGLIAALGYRARRRWARVAAVAVPLVWAVAVGASRVYLGMHWPSDVVAGWLLATALAVAVLPPLGALLARYQRDECAKSVRLEDPRSRN